MSSRFSLEIEKCKKRKYKKPLLKKCASLGIAANDSMTMEQICNLLHSLPVKTPLSKSTKTTLERKKKTKSSRKKIVQRRSDKKTLMETKLEASDFDFIANYIRDCYALQ